MYFAFVLLLILSVSFLYYFDYGCIDNNNFVYTKTLLMFMLHKFFLCAFILLATPI